MNIWYFFLDRFRFTYLVLFATILAGFGSLLVLPREANPEIVVPIGVVTTVYPGASAKDVERLVTDEIEDKIQNLDELDQFTSSSREGISSIVVQFDAKSDIDDRIRALRDAVNNAEPQLPSEVDRPFVSEVNFSDTPIVVFGLAADVSEGALKRMAQDFQDEFETVSGVSDVSLVGDREEEVVVTVEKTRLDQYSLGITDLVSTIQSANLTFPIGSIKTDDIRYAVRLDSELVDPDEVENLPIREVNGIPIYIRDVASVRFDLAEAKSIARVSEDGAPSLNAITISLKKKSGGDITKIVDEAKDKASALIESTYPEAKIIVTFDSADEVAKSLGNLTRNGISTIIIISLLLFFFLGGREALLAGMSIPITFLIGFIGLVIFDSSINFLSLFSLILALGIVVDNGIVITEGLHEHIKAGELPYTAARKTIAEFQWPLIAGTMTTVAAFVPMLFMGGILGQFVRHIPITVNLVLIGSLITALVFLPLIGSRFLKPRNEKKKETVKQRYIDPLINRLLVWYEGYLRNLLSSKKKQKLFGWGLVIAFFISLSLPITGVLPIIMFGENDADFFYIGVEAPVGTTLEVTDKVTRIVEDVLYEDSRIESFYVDIGHGNPLDDNAIDGSQIATFTVNLFEDRKEKTTDVLDEYRDKFTFITDAKVSLQQLDSGPPTGAPVLISFKGPDLEELERLTNESARILESIDGAVEIGTSFKESALEFVIDIDREKAVQLGFSPIQIAQTVRTAVAGTEASTIRYQGEDINVVVTQALNPFSRSADDRAITTIDEIKQMSLTSPSGQQVALSTLVSTKVEAGTNAIPHLDGDREAKTTAQVSGVNPAVIFDAFEPQIQSLGMQDGYTIKLGGEAEDVQESFNDLFRALFIGIFLIAAILLLQFNSFKQPFFILLSLPLSLIGVLPGLTIMGQQLSFPAFIGIIALSGVVVNDAIILMDKINRNRGKQMPKLEAIVDAGRARLQPIMLTTITTIAGILPLTLSDPIWGPLGWSIIFGLLFATVLTLIVIPMLYLKWGENELGSR